MKLKYTFETMEMDDQIMAIPIGDSASEFKGIIKLNDSAAKIFSLLNEEITEEEIVKQLTNQFSNSTEELKMYVHEYIEELSKEGILE